ncbi:hypothetical protein PRZ48_005366 [Zasmidium cellare]|uniref:C2H2-type domain-containing protein n=1 Tax=Zasmidium cellare TaxID=395010 RepID=A0ABR0ETK8_ZASCE|nr:hypothetical protein PRZ48_005366 [Zasmidium cellare]
MTAHEFMLDFWGNMDSPSTKRRKRDHVATPSGKATGTSTSPSVLQKREETEEPPPRELDLPSVRHLTDLQGTACQMTSNNRASSNPCNHRELHSPNTTDAPDTASSTPRTVDGFIPDIEGDAIATDFLHEMLNRASKPDNFGVDDSAYGSNPSDHAESLGLRLFLENMDAEISKSRSPSPLLDLPSRLEQCTAEEGKNLPDNKSTILSALKVKSDEDDILRSCTTTPAQGGSTSDQGSPRLQHPAGCSISHAEGFTLRRPKQKQQLRIQGRRDWQDNGLEGSTTSKEISALETSPQIVACSKNNLESGRLVARSKSCPPDYPGPLKAYHTASKETAPVGPSSHGASADTIDRHLDFLLRQLGHRVEALLESTLPVSPASSDRTTLSTNSNTSVLRRWNGRAIKKRSVSVPSLPRLSISKSLRTRSSTAASAQPERMLCMNGGPIALADGNQASDRTQQPNVVSAHGLSSAVNGRDTSQKRSHDPDGSDKQSSNDQCPLRKRRKKDSKTGSNAEGRFPCIFHVGEPERYPEDDKKYEHISQMMRHVRTSHHMWLVCEKCFTEFDNLSAQQQHCRSGMDACWEALFQLKYPDKPVPSIFSSNRQSNQSTNIPMNGDLRQAASSNANGLDNNELPETLFSEHDPDAIIPTTETFEGLSAISTIDFSNLASNFDFSPSQNQTILDLHKKIALLEQRLSQPDKRQREVENLFGVVWEAFEATNSPQARPGSRLHKLVSEMVPGVTSGTQSEQSTVEGFKGGLHGQGQPYNSQQYSAPGVGAFGFTDNAAVYEAFPELDAIFASVAGSSGFITADSAYGSSSK